MPRAKRRKCGNLLLGRCYNSQRVLLVEGLEHKYCLSSGAQDWCTWSRCKAPSPIVGLELLKRSKTKAGYGTEVVSLNFSTLNQLAKQGLVRGLLKLKFKKHHLCSACSLRKRKKSSHKPKADDTNQEKNYLLHMDLCGPMHVESINGKKCILVIVDDYSRFTWVKFLRSKDEAPEVIIKCLKQIQVRMNATVRNIRIDNGNEFVNQTLKDNIFMLESHIKHPLRALHNRKLTTMDSEQFSSGPAPQLMTSRTLSSGLVPNSHSLNTYVPLTKNDWDILFQPMFDEILFTLHQVLFLRFPQLLLKELLIQPVHLCVEESPKTPHFHNDPLHETLHEDSTFQGLSSNVWPSHTPLDLLGKWTKNHPLANVIGYPSRLVFTRNFLALRWHLKEIHVTWSHLEKK
ncbi:retrovirus-related pol polyprotein from transposon TNT 1-94 [Tanacetum coccineum]